MAGRSSSDIMRGAYWPQWRRNVESIDTSLFTHAYFAFLTPQNGTFTFNVSTETSEQLSQFTRTLRSKGRPIKILLSIGGAAAGTDIFAAMASDPGSRHRFINSAIGVARRYDFDGLDLDWEFPTNALQMVNLGRLLEEWRSAITNEARVTSRDPLLLAAAVYYSVKTYDNHKYPVPSMAKSLDWINVMTYDYHGPWEADTPPIRTGAHTALFDPNSIKNTDDGLRSWIKATMPKDKLVLGLAMYGRVWNLNNMNEYGIGSGATIPEDENSRIMTFSDILQFNNNNGSRVVRDNMPDGVSSHSVYAVSGETWIGYDDKECIKRKVEYAREQGIKGYFFWEIGQDSNWTLSREAFNA